MASFENVFQYCDAGVVFACRPVVAITSWARRRSRHLLSCDRFCSCGVPNAETVVPPYVQSNCFVLRADGRKALDFAAAPLDVHGYAQISAELRDCGRGVPNFVWVADLRSAHIANQVHLPQQVFTIDILHTRKLLCLVFLQSSMDRESKVSNKTKMIWVETPTNPMLNVIDIVKVSEISRRIGALLVVDNTFATPYLQQPLNLGADIVLHSATKYLGGHSDLVLGALVVQAKDIADKLYFIQNASGAVCGPMDSFLTLRGIKTLQIHFLL